MKAVVVLLGLALLALPIVLLSAVPARASGPAEATAPAEKPAAGLPAGLGYLAAALAVGLGSIGAGLAVGATASAAVGAVAEREEVAGKALVFVGLAEGIAIYGLVIAIMILNRL